MHCIAGVQRHTRSTMAAHDAARRVTQAGIMRGERRVTNQHLSLTRHGKVHKVQIEGRHVLVFKRIAQSMVANVGVHEFSELRWSPYTLGSFADVLALGLSFQ